MGKREEMEMQIHHQMVERGLYGGLGGGCGPTLVCMVLLMVVGCKSVKSFESHEEKKVEVSADVSKAEKKSGSDEGSKQVTEKEVRDSVGVTVTTEKSDSVETVVDTDGNVIGKNSWHNEKTTIRETRDRDTKLKDSLMFWKNRYDSLMTYKSKYDSLMSARKDETEKVKVQEGWSLSLRDIIIAFAVLGVVMLIWWVREKIPWLRR